MASFVSGLIQGGVDQASKKKKGDDDDKKKKKKRFPMDEVPIPMSIVSAKRGGKVKRTGIARLHKGEQVLTAKQAKRYRSKAR